jgi:hypothetical protein
VEWLGAWMLMENGGARFPHTLWSVKWSWVVGRIQRW